MSDFLEFTDLAAEALGGTVLAASDEFFAPKENLLKAGDAQWIADLGSRPRLLMRTRTR